MRRGLRPSGRRCGAALRAGGRPEPGSSRLRASSSDARRARGFNREGRRTCNLPRARHNDKRRLCSAGSSTRSPILLMEDHKIDIFRIRESRISLTPGALRLSRSRTANRATPTRNPNDPQPLRFCASGARERLVGVRYSNEHTCGHGWVRGPMIINSSYPTGGPCLVPETLVPSAPPRPVGGTPAGWPPAPAQWPLRSSASKAPGFGSWGNSSCA